MDDINGSIRSMLTLLDDDSSSESEAGDIDDLLSSHEDLLSKCPTYEVRARSRPSHASTLPLTPFPHAQYVPNALAGPHGRKSRLAPHDAALPATGHRPNWELLPAAASAPRRRRRGRRLANPLSASCSSLPSSSASSSLSSPSLSSPSSSSFAASPLGSAHHSRSPLPPAQQLAPPSPLAQLGLAPPTPSLPPPQPPPPPPPPAAAATSLASSLSAASFLASSWEDLRVDRAGEAPPPTRPFPAPIGPSFSTPILPSCLPPSAAATAWQGPAVGTAAATTLRDAVTAARAASAASVASASSASPVVAASPAATPPAAAAEAASRPGSRPSRAERGRSGRRHRRDTGVSIRALRIVDAARLGPWPPAAFSKLCNTLKEPSLLSPPAAPSATCP